MLPFGQTVPVASPMHLFPGRPRPTSAVMAIESCICEYICMYEIRFAAGLVHDLDALRSGERRLVLDGIQRRLRHEPTRPTKHVKRLRKLLPPFEHVPPIWQLRIGEHRVFYDVDEVEKVVSVRAVRRKPPHMTTEHIL